MALGEMMRECEKVDLPMTLAQLKRIKEQLDDRNLSLDNIRQMFHELMNRLWDELDTRVFYQIESRKSSYYEEPEKIIGADILAAFPTAGRELTDAARCYPVGRNTACVFHLMRDLESGLASIAKIFAVPSDHSTGKPYSNASKPKFESCQRPDLTIGRKSWSFTPSRQSFHGF
jgi:hypothetical protein